MCVLRDFLSQRSSDRVKIVIKWHSYSANRCCLVIFISFYEILFWRVFTFPYILLLHFKAFSHQFYMHFAWPCLLMCKTNTRNVQCEFWSVYKYNVQQTCSDQIGNHDSLCKYSMGMQGCVRQTTIPFNQSTNSIPNVLANTWTSLVTAWSKWSFSECLRATENS